MCVFSPCRGRLKASSIEKWSSPRAYSFYAIFVQSTRDNHECPRKLRSHSTCAAFVFIDFLWLRLCHSVTFVRVRRKSYCDVCIIILLTPLRFVRIILTAFVLLCTARTCRCSRGYCGGLSPATGRNTIYTPGVALWLTPATGREPPNLDILYTPRPRRSRESKLWHTPYQTMSRKRLDTPHTKPCRLCGLHKLYTPKAWLQSSKTGAAGFAIEPRPPDSATSDHSLIMIHAEGVRSRHWSSCYTPKACIERSGDECVSL